MSEDRPFANAYVEVSYCDANEAHWMFCDPVEGRLTGASISAKLDPTPLLLIVGVLVLILLTVYLIIYNVFQVSVAGKSRFYGLLKTIGTTPRRLRRIIRNQALMLPLPLPRRWNVPLAL